MLIEVQYEDNYLKVGTAHLHVGPDDVAAARDAATKTVARIVSDAVAASLAPAPDPEPTPEAPAA